jgi:hypothetical protein
MSLIQLNNQTTQALTPKSLNLQYFPMFHKILIALLFLAFSHKLWCSTLAHQFLLSHSFDSCRKSFSLCFLCKLKSTCWSNCALPNINFHSKNKSKRFQMLAMHIASFKRKRKIILLDKGSNPNPTLKNPYFSRKFKST